MVVAQARCRYAGTAGSQGETSASGSTGEDPNAGWDVVEEEDDFGSDYLGTDTALPPVDAPVAEVPIGAPALGPGAHDRFL